MSIVRNVTLAELFSFALEKQAKAIRVGMPGRVEKFYPNTQTADVKPLLFEHDVAEDGTEQNAEIKIVSGVPVQFPTANGFMITFPVVAGDMVWLQFADRSLDRWYKRGEDVDPVDLRRHDLSDAVAILGVLADPDKLTEFDHDRMVLGKSGGKRIAFEDSKIHLGVGHNADAADNVALASLVKSEISALRETVNSAINTMNQNTVLLAAHKHPVVINTLTATPDLGLAMLSSATTPDTVGDVKSDILLAD